MRQTVHRKNLLRFFALALSTMLVFSGLLPVLANDGEGGMPSTASNISAAGEAITPDPTVSSLAEQPQPAERPRETADTADGLAELFARYAAGELAEDTAIVLAADIDLATLTVGWQCPGTEDRPFSGLLEGGGYTVTGVGRAEIPSLLGIARGATVQNLTLRLVGFRMEEEAGLYAGLFEQGEGMTVINCQVIAADAPTAFLLPMLLGGILPDTSWYDTAPSATEWTLTDVAEVAGIAVLVSDGTTSFAGKTIKLSGEIDMAPMGAAFEPIGTPDTPFKGTIDGGIAGSQWGRATLKNLTIAKSDKNNIGFIGYGEGAVVKNVYFEDVKISGSQNVGAIAGYLAQGTINNCGVSGQVGGAVQVGGLVGALVETTDPSVITASFSTARVSGSTSVGGIAGLCRQSKITRCFVSASVSGVTQVGGIAGNVMNSRTTGTALADYSIAECGVSGAVRGVGLTGGLAGTGSASSSRTVTTSYTAATVEASSDSGTAGGGVMYIRNSYASGQMVAPVPGDTYIKSVIGFSGSGENNLTRPDSVVGVNRKTMGAGGDFFGTPSGSTPSTFTFNGCPGSDTAFVNANNLTFEYAGNVYTPVSGVYPQLACFNSASALPPEFQVFSTLSTQVLPNALTLYSIGDSDVYASREKTGTPAAYQLPTFSGMGWKLRIDSAPSSSITIEDPTLPGGVNTVSIDSDKIKLAYPIYKDTEVMLSLTPSGGASNVSVDILVTLKDSSVRPTTATVPSYFYVDKAAMTDPITRFNNSHIFEFPEAIQLSSTATKVELEEYNDANFTGGTTVAKYGNTAMPITLTLLGDSKLKVEWGLRDVIQQGKYYKLTIENIYDKCEAGITDCNAFTATYYMYSLPNQAPELTFDTGTYGAVSTNNTGTVYEQVIRITQNDPNFLLTGGVVSGVLASDDNDVITVTASNATLAPVSGATGHVAGTTINTANFFHAWGIYEFTYQVTDSQGEASNTVKRIYYVEGDLDLSVAVSGGGRQTIQPDALYVQFGDDDLLAIMESVLAGNSLKNAVTQEVLARSGYNAEIMESNGNVVRLGNGITFDLNLGPVTNNSFINTGSFAGMTYSLLKDDGTAIVAGQPMTVYGARGVKDMLQIVDTGTNIVADQGDITSVQQIQQMINPRVQYVIKGVTKTVPESQINFTMGGTLDTDSLLTQFFTLQAKNVLGLGFNLPPKTYTVTLTKTAVSVIPPVTPESSDPESDKFWEEIEAKILKSGAGDTVVAKVGYRHIYAPVSVMKTLQDQSGVTLEIQLAENVVVSLHSSQVDLSRIESDRYYVNINVVPMDNLYISRDIPQLGPMQQFYTVGRGMAYGKVEVSMPAEEALRSYSGQLALYSFDNATKEYALVQRLSNGITGNSASFTLAEMPGECVVAPFPLNARKENPNTGD